MATIEAGPSSPGPSGQISPAAEEPRTNTLLLQEMSSPSSQQPIMEGTSGSVTQISPVGKISSPLQQAMRTDTESREVNLPPLSPPTKRPQGTLSPINEVASSSTRSPALKRVRFEGRTKEATDEEGKEVGLSLTALEKQPAPSILEPTSYPIPLANPEPEHVFAWHLVESYAIAQQDALRPPKLTDDEIQTMKTFGIKKMINACLAIAERIPGNYKRSHQYLAERGVMSTVREMERIVNEKRGTM